MKTRLRSKISENITGYPVANPITGNKADLALAYLIILVYFMLTSKLEMPVNFLSCDLVNAFM